MASRNIFRVWLIGLALLVQACASTPSAPTQKDTNHIKTVIPAPFPITTRSLRSERIDRLLAELVKEGSVPGLSVLIYEGDTETYYGAAGYSDIETKTLLKRSDVGRYYSMTKPITGVAMMMLYEQGKFKLDDPVSKYLPEFTNMKVYKGARTLNGDLVGQAVNRPISIRDLMRHTAGFTYGFTTTEIDKQYAANDLLSYDQTNAAFSKKLAKELLLHEPGTQYHYSVATDVQGRLIEVLSGQKLGAYFEANIFRPLGMSHTGFMVKAKDTNKFGSVYGYGKKGLFPMTDGDKRVPLGLTVDRPFLQDVQFESGGGGLVSSIDDYAKFALMLQRNDGQLIKPETLALMTKNQLGNIPNGDLGEGASFGLNFSVKTAPQNSGDYRVPAGSFYWGGMAGTAFLIDDKNDLTFLMHMQVMSPNWATIRTRMAAAVYGP